MCIAFVKNAAPSLPPDNNKNQSHSGILKTSSHPNSNSKLKNAKSLGVQSTKPEKKRLHFKDTNTEIIATCKPSSEMSTDERALTHWQVSDYEYFRGTARIIASEVLKLSATQPPSAHSYDTILTRAHQLCSHNQPSKDLEEKQDLPSLDDNVCLPPNLFAALAHWAKAGHSRRGLEKFCVPHHMQSRPLERQAVIQAVLITQELLADRRREAPKDGKFILGSLEFSLSLPDDEILRMVSEIFSQTSRKFATAMGHADAAAVGTYEHTKI